VLVFEALCFNVQCQETLETFCLSSQIANSKFPAFRCERGSTPGTVVSKFRQYNQSLFTHVVFTANEFTYWIGNSSALLPRFPALVNIPSAWEERVILLGRPVGAHPPTVADRKPEWEAAVELSRGQCVKDLPPTDLKNRDWWEVFHGAPATGLAAATGLYARPTPASLWPPSLRAPPGGGGPLQPTSPVGGGAPPAALAAYGPVMRSGAAAAKPLVRPARAAELSELEPLSFAFVAIAKSTGKGSQREFPLPTCLVQLPAAFPAGFNSKDPKALIKVRWWQPDVDGYRGKWAVWFRGKSQWTENVERGAIEVAGVVVFTGSNNQSVPLAQRWVRVKKASLDLLSPLPVLVGV